MATTTKARTKDVFFLHGFKDNRRVSSFRTEDGNEIWTTFERIVPNTDSLVLTILREGLEPMIYQIRPVSSMEVSR